MLADFHALIFPFFPLKKFIIVLFHSSYALVILSEAERTVLGGSFICTVEFGYCLITGIIVWEITHKIEDTKFLAYFTMPIILIKTLITRRECFPTTSITVFLFQLSNDLTMNTIYFSDVFFLCSVLHKSYF